MISRSTLAVLTCCLLMGGARGDEPGDQEARRLFQEGRDAFEQKSYQRAYEAFRQSYVISQRPELLFNMSSVLKELGRPHDAADELRAYLRVVPTALDRAEIEQRILTLEETQRILDRDKDKPKPSGEPTAAPLSAPPAAAPSLQLVAVPADSPTVAREPPSHRRWWIWATVAGVAVVGLTVGLTVGLVPNNAAAPTTQGGTQRALFQ